MQLTIDDLPAAIRDAKKGLRADLPGYAATFRELEGDIARQVDAIRRAHAHGHDVIPVVPFADYWTKYNPANGFQFDYQSQVETWFSGLPGLWVQDAACQSGAGPILDRSREHLSSSDAGIAIVRRSIG